MKKIVFILSVLCSIVTYGQEEYEIKERLAVPKQSIVFNAGYFFPSINNTNSDWKNNSGLGMEFSVDFRKQFRTMAMEGDDVVLIPTKFAIGFGLGMTIIDKSAMAVFKNNLTSFDFEDKDNDKCVVKLELNDVNESVNLTYLDVPLYLEISKPSRTKINTYLKMGVKASLKISNDDKLLLKGTYTATGTYTEIGDKREPVGTLILHDISELGYLSGQQCYNKNEYELNPVVFWGNITGGVNIPLKNDQLATWILRIGAKIDCSINAVYKISKNSDSKKFTDDKKYPFYQVNILGNGRILNLGLSIAMIYCF